jgi:transcriptional regulator NrdR family protein
MIRCPHCGELGAADVTETRKDPRGVFRRRRCSGCAKSFITKECATKDPMPARRRVDRVTPDAPRGVRVADAGVAVLLRAWR